MNRAALFLVVILGLAGCSSPARYIERSGDTGGVVAIPANTDTFPTYNRSEAMALIQKHVGPNFEIVGENEVPIGKRTLNDQQVNNEQTWNSSNPLLPASKQTVQNATTTQDVNEYRIMYRKKTPVSMSPAMGSAMGPAPVTPAVGLQPTAPVTPAVGLQPQAPIGGTVPGALPGGGPISPLSSGVIPAVGPAPAAGGTVYGSAGAVIGKIQ